MELNNLKCISGDDINLEEYVKFRNEVKSYMENPEWLGDFSVEELKNLLENYSKIFMFYDGNNRPVCSMMQMPGDSKMLKECKLELNSDFVCDYGPMFVDRDYIGNGLQLKMLNQLDEYSKFSGFRYALCTVHPENIYSINNIEKDGFKMQGEKEFRRGKRLIYLKIL